jgi:hypothetical protein
MALNANTRIMFNRKNQSTTVLFTGNSTIVVAGNSTVSDIATGDEVLTGGYITQIWFGSPSGNTAYWTISRGSNVISVFDSSAYLDFAGAGNPLSLDPGATLTVGLTNSGAGTMMVEVQKLGSFPTGYAQNN